MGGPDGETRIAARRRVRICQKVVKMIQPLERTPGRVSDQQTEKKRGRTEVMTQMTKHECGG
jgi:hypothetical protein